jgi:putative redox protein
VKQFCDQRGIPTEKIKLTQDLEYNQMKRMIGKILIQIHVPQDFPEKYEQAVIQTASLCAVKKHLSNEIEFEVVIVRG